VNKCQRCGFEDQLTESITEPWNRICRICSRAEEKILNRQKPRQIAEKTPLGSYLKEAESLKEKTDYIFTKAFKIEKTEEKIVEEKEEKYEPIVRVPGTDFIMERFNSFGGYHYLDEEEKNILSLADLRSYQGKKREITARWLIENFSNRGDIVLDPFSGSGMFSLVGKVEGRKPIAFDILTSAIASTQALINTPPRTQIIRTGQQIVKTAREVKSNMDLYPKSIKKWYDLTAFKDAIRFYEVINYEEYGHPKPFYMSDRMKNFQTQIALYILQRISYGRGGYTWKMTEKAYRKRAMWDRDQGDEYLRHIKKVTRNEYNQWDTRFEAKVQTIMENTGLENGSVDRIITDPPYGSMINYIGQVWVEEWLLGWKDLVTMDEVLGVSSIPKKANQFAHKHMIQDLDTFFQRMELAMREMYRVLRNDGTMVFIIGDITETGKIKKLINPFRPLEKMGRRVGFEEIYCIDKPFTRQSTYKHTHGQETKYERVIVFRKGIKDDDILTDREIEADKKGLEAFL